MSELDDMLRIISEQERADLERQHGEQLLQIFNARGQQNEDLAKLMNRAWSEAAESSAEAGEES